MTADALAEVIITPALWRRDQTPRDLPAEHTALVDLARQMARAPDALFQRLVDHALALCRADSAGLSLLERNGQRSLFRWVALAGAYAKFVDGTSPASLDDMCKKLLANTVIENYRVEVA